MDCGMESPLDVLSRAATMLQKEEREATLKRNADHPDSPHQNLNVNSPRYKRCKGSSSSSLKCDDSSDEAGHSSEDERNSRKCIATQTAFSSFNDPPVSPVKPPAYSQPPPPPYSSIDTSHLPWQPFIMSPAMPHTTSTLPGYPLPSRHMSTPNQRPSSPPIDNSMPLNLSTHHKTDRPSVIISPNGSTNTIGGGNDSRNSSPGVPERLLHGRPMTTAAGNVFYPSTVSGANLAGLEARTTRKETMPDICDPSIEEHFRRSLGTAYTNYVSRSSSSSPPRLSPSQPSPHRISPSPPNSLSSSRSSDSGESKVKLLSVSGTVDDHFAKALGNQTWNKIKVETEVTEKSPDTVDDHFAKALGATWHQIQAQRREHHPHT